MKVIKRDGRVVDFDEQKIINAVTKSSYRAMIKLYNDDYTNICNKVLDIIDEEDFYVEEYEEDIVSVDDMHDIVIRALEECGFDTIAKSYRDYRNYKEDFVKMLDDVYAKAQSITYIGDVSNANTDSSMISTQRSLIYGELNKNLYQKFFMTTEELKVCNDGYIYINDMKDRRDGINCCHADIGNMLHDGFEMGNVWYNEPKSLDVAFDVMSDITMNMASQQYGGFTIPRVDSILAPYAEKSFKHYMNKYIDMGVLDVKAELEAMKDVRREFEQGFQSWEMCFNTVGSSRGDYPFIAISFGIDTSRWGKMATEVCLEVRKNGQGKM